MLWPLRLPALDVAVHWAVRIELSRMKFCSSSLATWPHIVPAVCVVGCDSEGELMGFQASSQSSISNPGTYSAYSAYSAEVSLSCIAADGKLWGEADGLVSM
jgi:hypothetical protein